MWRESYGYLIRITEASRLLDKMSKEVLTKTSVHELIGKREGNTLSPNCWRGCRLQWATISGADTYWNMSRGWADADSRNVSVAGNAAKYVSVSPAAIHKAMIKT
jgi:hypothetical protein